MSAARRLPLRFRHGQARSAPRLARQTHHGRHSLLVSAFSSYSYTPITSVGVSWAPSKRLDAWRTLSSVIVFLCGTCCRVRCRVSPVVSYHSSSVTACTVGLVCAMFVTFRVWALRPWFCVLSYPACLTTRTLCLLCSP